MTLDGAQRATTAFVALSVLASAAIVVAAHAVVGVAVVGLVFLALGGSWAMAPRGIVVDGGELRVERRAWAPVCIPLGSIAGASAIDVIGPGTIRVFGVGGFFGSYGTFENRALGQFRLYATRGKRAVVVRRAAGEPPIVITPDDVEGVLAAIAGGGRAG